MKENAIVQFIGFETSLQPDAFILLWEEYVREFSDKDVAVTLHQQSGFKSRFKFISKHIWPAADFQFTFKKGRHSGFPEREARVIQLGGYMPIQVECRHDTGAGDVKLMLFLSQAEMNMPVLKKLKPYRFLNVYEAYYESCVYTHILEFFVEELYLSTLIDNIKSVIEHPQIAAFKESLVSSCQLKQVTT